MRKIDTPTQKTCEDVAALMGIALQRTVKSVALMGVDAEGKPEFVLALVRGDHVVNEIKLAKLAGLGEYRLATEGEIDRAPRQRTGLPRPGRAPSAEATIRVIADRSVAAMADFVVGANEKGYHLAGVNWGRDLPEPRRRRRHPQRGRRRSLARRPRHARHRARHRGRPRVPARPQVRRSDGAAPCSTRPARRRCRRWAATASACRASSPRRSNRTSTPTASSGRRRWRRGRSRCA